jgi:hypothetical protein
MLLGNNLKRESGEVLVAFALFQKSQNPLVIRTGL